MPTVVQEKPRIQNREAFEAGNLAGSSAKKSKRLVFTATSKHWSFVFRDRSQRVTINKSKRAAELFFKTIKNVINRLFHLESSDGSLGEGKLRRAKQEIYKP